MTTESAPPAPSEKPKRVLKKPRKANRRNHPAIRGRPRGVWYPDLVGVIKGYPKTEEAFKAKQEQCRAQVIRLNAEGKMHRRGIPDGWAGKKKKAIRARAKAQKEAKRIIEIMVEKNLVDPDALGNEALQFAIEVVRDKTSHRRDSLTAARLVLDFSKAKPASKSELTVNKAEDFLAAVLASDKK